MIRLLQIEFIKLWNNKSSRFLIIAYFGLLCCIALVSIIKFPFGPGIRLADMGIFNFPYIWHLNTYIAGYLKLFLAIVIVSMVANEYSNKTIKQNLIDGLSKKEFILSKFLTVVCLSIVSTIFVFVVSLILGLLFSDYNELAIIFSELEFLLAFFVKLIGFFSFCLFLGILVKRSAFALGFLILWQIFEGLVALFFNQKMFADETVGQVMSIMPLHSMYKLIEQPATRLEAVQTVANQVGEKIELNYAVHWYEILIVLAWTAIFIYSSYILLKKRDL